PEAAAHRGAHRDEGDRQQDEDERAQPRSRHRTVAHETLLGRKDQRALAYLTDWSVARRPADIPIESSRSPGGYSAGGVSAPPTGSSRAPPSRPTDPRATTSARAPPSRRCPDSAKSDTTSRSPSAPRTRSTRAKPGCASWKN